MTWEWFSWLRRNSRQAKEASVDLDLSVIYGRRASAALKGLAEVGEENLETLARVVEASRKFEGGDQVVDAAARVYREGLAALLTTPLQLFPTDPETSREAMQIPSNGSTSSQPMLANGPPSGSSQSVPPPDAAHPHQSDPGTPGPVHANGQRPELPRRPRGRPKGVPNKPKPPLLDGKNGRNE